MKLSRFASCLCALFLSAAQLWAAGPAGLEFIFNGVEPGRRFHAFWPPIAGDDTVGAIIIARHPNKIEAFFETIESPDFASANPDNFKKASKEIVAGDLTRTRTIGVDVAFSQLDGLSSATKTAPSAKNVEAAASADDQGRTSTGLDLSKVKQATITIPKLKVTFYTLATLTNMGKTGSDSLLNRLGQQTLSKASRGWIVSRVLIAESLDYELTATDKFDAGFFAKLLTWLPTASIRYKNASTISISTNTPVTIGYKLWRPDRGIEEAAAGNKNDLTKIGIAAEDIDKVLDGTYDRE